MADEGLHRQGRASACTRPATCPRSRCSRSTAAIDDGEPIGVPVEWDEECGRAAAHRADARRRPRPRRPASATACSPASPPDDAKARLHRPRHQAPGASAPTPRSASSASRRTAAASCRSTEAAGADASSPTTSKGAKDGELVSVEVDASAGALRPARARASSSGSARCQREGDQPHRPRGARHPACLPADVLEPKPRRPKPAPPWRTARTGASCRSSPSTRPTPGTTTTRSMPSRTTIREQSGRLRRHRRHRRCRLLCPPRLGARPRGGEARQLGLFPRPRRADAAGAHLQRPLLAAARARTGPALAVRMRFDADGRKRGHRFHRVMMRSAAKLSYEQAQAAIDGRPTTQTAPLLEPVLKPLWAAYAALARGRDRREPLELDLPERKILLEARRLGRPHRRAAAARCPPADRGVHDPGERRRRGDARGEERAARLPHPRRALAGEARGAARVPRFARHDAAARRGNLRPSQFNRILDAGRRHAERRPRQRGGPALAEPGGIRAGEHRPFRPEPPPLRPLHLADPPLCRPHRAPRADRGAEPRRGRPAAEDETRSSTRSPARSPSPSAAPWRPSATPSTA